MYAKVFDSLLSSSVWDESPATRCAWLTLLILADQDGFIHRTVNALARAANLTVEEMQGALDKFQAPDPSSKTTDEDGRRVVQDAPNVWRVVNHTKYRTITDNDVVREQTRERVRRYRLGREQPASTVTVGNAPVTVGNAPVTVGNAPVTVGNAPVTVGNATQTQIYTQKEQIPPTPLTANVQVLVPVIETALSDPEHLKVWLHWKQTYKGKDRARWGTERRELIATALGWGFSADDLCKAISGGLRDPWVMGQNREGTKHDDLRHLIGSMATIEHRMGLVALPPLSERQPLSQAEDIIQRAKAAVCREEVGHE